MQKEITIKEFASELVERIDKDKGIDCCREEIKRFAEMAAKKMPGEMIRVSWRQ